MSDRRLSTYCDSLHRGALFRSLTPLSALPLARFAGKSGFNPKPTLNIPPANHPLHIHTIITHLPSALFCLTASPTPFLPAWLIYTPDSTKNVRSSCGDKSSEGCGERDG